MDGANSAWRSSLEHGFTLAGVNRQDPKPGPFNRAVANVEKT
jgi:hypothetical protein